MNTTLPEVHVLRHGVNEYGKRDVATKGTVKGWIDTLPQGTTFTVQEATDHIVAAVGWSDMLLHESMNHSDVEAVGYCLDESDQLELLSSVDFFYASDPLTQYRKK